MDAERAERGKKSLKRDDDPSNQKNPTPAPSNNRPQTTDSGYMVRDETPKGFFYLDTAPWMANIAPNLKKMVLLLRAFMCAAFNIQRDGAAHSIARTGASSYQN